MITAIVTVLAVTTIAPPGAMTTTILATVAVPIAGGVALAITITAAVHYLADSVNSATVRTPETRRASF
eukprot:13744176-Alexandrium_andersonii.AAC.1